MARPIAGFLVAVMMVAAMALASMVGAGLAQAQAQTDRDILVDLYNATDGPNWLNNTNWLSDEPLSEWYGVTTDGSGRVTWLDLPGNRLSGEIPAELGGLSNLEELFLGDNRLTGTIPSELGGLSNLTYLDLFRNQLTGAVPSELSSLSNLEGLHLSDNQLTGTIPSGLSGLSNLEGLFLDSNQLTGAIPSELGDLSNLVDLFLAGNQLTGTIPSELAAQSNLEQLFLADNHLSGEIPAELGNLSNLRQLDLRDNPILSGPLPASFTGLTSLTYLRLDGTQLCAPTDAAFQAWLGGIGGRLGVVNCAADQRRTVTLSMMRPVVGAELKATLSDPDGAVTDVMWQWARSLDGTTNWVDIAGATSMSYTPTPMDDGYYLRATATYTDPLASGKTSMAVSDHAVTEGDPLVARYDANANGMIDKAEVIAAINDYLFGDADEAISKTEVIRLINLYLFGPSTPSNPPGAPEGLTAAGNGQTRMDLSWSAPSSDGGAAITGYRIEVSENGSTWTDLVANTGNAATSYSHTGLRAGSTRHYRVSAINSAGTGPASNIATGATDTTPTADRAALVALYNATNGPNWANSTNWLTAAPLDEWFGVTTDSSSGRVTELSLGYNNLFGELPAELGDLTALENLELDGSYISDLSALSSLTSLRYLRINQNAVSDLSALSGLTRLESLTLNWNPVQDVSPLLSLTNLRYLDLGQTPLGGPSINVHIPILTARGVTVLYDDRFDYTAEGFTVEGGPQIYNDNIFVMPIEALSDGEQHADKYSQYAQRFYESFKDEFDFLMIVGPGFSQPRGVSHAFYAGVKNDVRGIGLDIFSAGDRYGSADKLQGVMFCSFLWAAQDLTISHELMHRWGAYVMPGEISDGHWFGPSNIYGFLGGLYTTSFDEITKLGEDTYFVDSSVVYLKDSYAPLELYLAGFIPPEEVPEFWVAADVEWVEWPSVFTATEIKEYTIDDVIAEHGRRIPGASQAQREFRAAAILLMDNNYPATSGKLEFLSDVITRYSHAGVDDDELSANFYETTGGRARIVMDGLAEFLKDSATVPGAPTGLTAAGNGWTRIALSWSAPSSDGGAAITGYRVEVSEDRMGWSDLVVNTGSTATSYSHTGLTAGSTRHYRVSAINSVGTGPASNLAAARTSTTGTDRAALVALYNATNGPNWANDTNWLTDAPLGAWHGVSTDASGRVTALRLYENGLSGSIPSEMGNLTSLEELILVGNGITEISGLSEVVSLRVLGLDYNNIPDLSPLADLTNLTDLSLSDTNVPDLSVLSDLINLTHLRLITTNTADLSPLSGLTNLTSLTLSHNSIADLSPLAELTNLTYLNFWENQIEDISALSGLTNLTGVGLGLNNVTDISALSGLTKLETLWLNNNNVTDISSLAGLTNLTELYLGSNSITDISALAALTSLMELDLASNNITDLAPLAGLTNLRNLDVRGNVLNDSSIAEHVPALESNGTVVLFDMRLSKGDFDIELVFLDDFTESQKRVLQYTALRWMAVIIEDVPEYEFTGVWSGQCGGQSFEIPSGERIDDLRIYVATGGQSPGIHGTGGIYVMREESHLPVVGCMTFDLSHANLLVTGLHEIGHVLGFASEVWNEFGFYQNPPNGDDHFSGPLAIAAFAAAGGSDYEGAKVPLRQGESHWRLSVLEGELMSPSGGGTLSAITVQSLADLGYGVDVAQADAYTLPRARGGG